jgi:class 3 adenylate cyclase/tetratricopeptide (TPR) repeat protein
MLDGAFAEARREERKVVSVVFVDLVGSTSRAERLDPEDVRAVLAPYHSKVRRELERYGGTVEKFIGDAIVAVFGAPVAHEDDAERAVRAALAAQAAIAQLNESDPALELEARVGVNTGEALVALDARPEAGEAMASGDVMNTAARLQAAAPTGGVLVGEATQRITARAIEYEETGAVDARGKALPVRAWRALRPRSRLGVDVALSARSELVGRERELDILAGALARARETREPQLVTIVGVPGIGKSRLVTELSRLVDADPELITWRQGRSLPYGEGVAFWALGEMVKAQAGIFETDGADTAGTKLAAAVGDVVPPAERAWVERQLTPLLGLGGALEPHPDQRAEAFAAWRRFLEALAESGPTVLVFEDLHWADDGLLDFVDALADRVSGVPMLVVCSARNELIERRPGWGGGKRNAVTVSLTPLSDDQTARLIAALLERSVLPAEQQQLVLQRAGGNPLYAEEFARMLGAGELVAGEIPDSLHGVVAARLDALPAPEKELLQLAAVLGKVFWTDALAALSELDPWLLDERLHALERKEFVRRDHRTAVEGARQYAFVHVLVRDGAYGQMPRGVRAQTHERVAAWIDALPPDRAEERADMLSHHLQAAIEYGRAAGLDVSHLQPAACAALVSAGDRAWTLGDSPGALSLWERARQLEPSVDPDPHLLLRIGRALLQLRGEGLAELERAASMLRQTDPAAAAEAELSAGEVVWQRGDREGAIPKFERALMAVESLPASPRKAYVMGQLARFEALAGRSAAALALAEQAIDAAQAVGDAALLGDLLNTRAIARGALGDANCLDDLERSLELGLETGSHWVGRAYLNLASTLVDMGVDINRAIELLEEGLTVAERKELLIVQRWYRGNFVQSLTLAGRWEESRRLAEAELGEPTPHYMRTAVLGDRGLMRLAGGEEGALDDLRESLESARGVGDPQALWPALAALAFGLAETGDPGGADMLLTELETVTRQALGFAGPWVVIAALAAADIGREIELFGKSATLLRTPWSQAAAAVDHGDLTAAADILADVNATPLEADVRLRLARQLLAQGRRVEASHALGTALAFYRAVGATASVRAAEALLPAAG